MTVSELIEKAKTAAESHILKKGSATYEFGNGDELACFISSSSARHSGQSWGRVDFSIKRSGSKKYSKFSKIKAIGLIGA